MRTSNKTPLTVLSCGISRRPVAALAFLLLTVFLQAPTGHAQQGKPGDALIQTFIELYQDKNPANRVAAMLLSVGMVDHAELVAALRKRLPTAPQGERELVLYTMAALSYDPLTRTSTSPADIDAWLDAFPTDYATYKIFSGAEEVLTAGLWNTQITNFLSILACDSKYSDKARTALAQDSEFRSAMPDANGRPRTDSPAVHLGCFKEDYVPSKAITPAPIDPGEPFSWEDSMDVGKKLTPLLNSKDFTTRVATLLVLRNINVDSSVFMDTLEQRRKDVQDPQELVLIDVLYDFPGDYLGKKSEEQLCRDFPKTPEGIAGLLELESKIYRRDRVYILSRIYSPDFIQCPDQNGIPLSFYILQSGKKYMTDTEYQFHLTEIANTVISGGGAPDGDKHSYRRAVRLGPPEFREYCTRYMEQEIQRLKDRTFEDVAKKNQAYMKARSESYLRDMHEALEEISGNAVGQ